MPHISQRNKKQRDTRKLLTVKDVFITMMVVNGYMNTSELIKLYALNMWIFVSKLYFIWPVNKRKKSSFKINKINNLLERILEHWQYIYYTSIYSLLGIFEKESRAQKEWGVKWNKQSNYYWNIVKRKKKDSFRLASYIILKFENILSGLTVRKEELRWWGSLLTCQDAYGRQDKHYLVWLQKKSGFIQWGAVLTQ